MQISSRTLILSATILMGISCGPNKSAENHTEKPEVDGMAYIPAGTFSMGGKSDQAMADEFPVHQVEVSAFYMDVHEVTNAQFKEFVTATEYVTVAERPLYWDELKKQLPPGTPKPPDSLLAPGSLVFTPTATSVDLTDYSRWWSWIVGANWQHPDGPESDISDRMDHPVVHVTYEDATAYAAWAGKRLATEAEWEWASMGGVSNAKYPWGNESIEKASDKANFWQGLFPYNNFELDGYFGTAPVKSFPANGYGLFDMAGNVWELCEDKYHIQGYQLDAAASNLTINPKGPDSSYDPREPRAIKYVVRGGSFLCNDSYCSGYRSSRRMSVDKESGLNHTGFRCVMDLPDTVD